MIDLRSDTVTKPTPAMRRAMFEAEVGDDVYREDPTVNRLEERAAEIAGKPAALFVPTGTMGNTIAIKLLTEHGQEVICDSRAHVLDYELAMVAWFSGCLVRAIPTVRGLLSAEEVIRHIRPPSPNSAATGAVEIEQTHNMGGGTVYPLSTVCGRGVYLSHEDALHATGQQGDGATLLSLRSDPGRQHRRGVIVCQIRQHLLHGTQATGQQCGQAQ